MQLNPDFLDFLSVLAGERVESLVIGGYAVSYHSRPRFTKDIDVLVGSERDNRQRLADALSRFVAARFAPAQRPVTSSTERKRQRGRNVDGVARLAFLATSYRNC